MIKSESFSSITPSSAMLSTIVSSSSSVTVGVTSSFSVFDITLDKPLNKKFSGKNNIFKKLKI